ncbi:hypothetical protein VNO78_16264 [Psophocarpus tetragonolobus]|uniref:Uncharacterized protein n=1 Tax=Psophocarpus tetragonolobus TaxID=3891 RepID=A0AAN9XKM5_PSOTE
MTRLFSTANSLFFEYVVPSGLPVVSVVESLASSVMLINLVPILVVQSSPFSRKSLVSPTSLTLISSSALGRDQSWPPYETRVSLTNMLGPQLLRSSSG